MQVARGHIGAAVVDGKIYAIGGDKITLIGNCIFATYGNVLNTTEVYDTVTDTWTTKTPPQYRITTGASAVSDDKIYFLATSSHLDLGPFLQIYNPKDDSWTVEESAPIYGGWSTTAAVTSPEGDSQQIVFFSDSSTYIYFPANSSWLIGTPMPQREVLLVQFL